MEPRPIRVVIADGSPFAGELMRTWLAAAGFAVVGLARDGAAAVELARSARPDVLAIGLRLAGIDGIAAIEQIMAAAPTPVVLVCGPGRGATVAARRAIELGAVDVLFKRTDAGDSFADALTARLRMAAGIKVVRSLPSTADRPSTGVAAGVVVIGASTGGPAAVYDLLRELPGEYAAGLVIVQHLPGAFVEAFRVQLSRRVPHPVRIANAGEAAGPGVVTLAPADTHLEFAPTGFVLTNGPKQHGFRPAIDVTMRSAARHFGAKCAGVLLTGMGRDGSAGLAAIRAAGGRTFAQTPSTCVVDGMPRAAIADGCVDVVDTPPRLAGRLFQAIQQWTRE